MAKIRFKELPSNQAVLFPTNLIDRIPENHPVRLVNEVVDNLDISVLLNQYKGGGCSSFHPRMMLKVLFYSYFSNVYSCRKIEKALRENIHFMWLSGDSVPDYRTINYFRGKRLQGHIHELFAQVVRMLAELGYVSLEKQYIDGTKIESAANRYTFVWRGSVEKNKEKLESKLQSVLSEIESAIGTDNQQNTEETARRIDSEELKERLSKINRQLGLLDKKSQKQVKKIASEQLPRLAKYERQLDTMGHRNSYSKTDPDATFMRMKQDHMKNGQLKPAYNTQISTEEQFVTHYSVGQAPGDTGTLIPHLQGFERRYQQQSAQVIADAGYGSEQNYEFMECNQIEAFVKYNYFHKEQKRAFKNNPFLSQNFFYNQARDYFVCPMGQHLSKVGEGERKSDLGYVSTVSYYQAQRCEGCPLRCMCHRAKGNRLMEVNHRLRHYRQQARERLMSPEGLMHRSKRPVEPEAVFGQIKWNNQFFRFRMRGLEKVNIEFGLVLIGHNLRKLARKVTPGISFTFFCPTWRLVLRPFPKIKRNGCLVGKNNRRAA